LIFSLRKNHCLPLSEITDFRENLRGVETCTLSQIGYRSAVFATEIIEGLEEIISLLS
jgi:hypothetical protein